MIQVVYDFLGYFFPGFDWYDAWPNFIIVFLFFVMTIGLFSVIFHLIDLFFKR